MENVANIFGIDHLVIAVRDVARTARFYTVFLGDPIYQDEFQVAYQVGVTKLFFGLPAGKFTPYSKDESGLNHLACGVKTLEELQNFRGILTQGEVLHSGIQIDKYGKKKFIWFDDPDGYRLELYCRAAEK